MARTLESIAAELRAEALDYPETYEENPWGDRVVKVGGKIFFFCGVHKDELYVTAKLPHSGVMALQLPFAEPTHYGMGKHGWVTAHFRKPAEVPVGMLHEWIEESFRAIAPRKILELIDAGKAAGAKPAKAAGPAAAAKPAKPTATILLIGNDELRLQRARRALGDRGIAVSGTAEVAESALAELARRKPGAVLIDLGRRAPDGLELAAAIARSEFRALPLLFAGARDAAGEKKARAAAPKLAGCARGAPGDPETVEIIAAALTARKGRAR